MRDTNSPDRDQVLYEKSTYLRVYSSSLLDEAQELCRKSGKLRKTNASLGYELRVIRSNYFRFVRAIGSHAYPAGFNSLTSTTVANETDLSEM